MLHTKFMKIGPPFLEKKISERVVTIYGHGGPDLKPSLSYDTAENKLHELECQNKYRR